jgi:hypothetical protein
VRKMQKPLLGQATAHRSIWEGKTEVNCCTGWRIAAEGVLKEHKHTKG